MTRGAIAAVLFAQASELPPLINYGVLGIMCAWFMWRDSKSLEEQRKNRLAQDRQTRALALLTLAISSRAEEKRQAQEMIDEVGKENRTNE